MRKTLLIIMLGFTMGLATAQDYVMGINFDAGGKFDASFNEGTWLGMSAEVEALEQSQGLDIELLEFEGTPDTFAQGLRSMAQQGAELIVAPGFSQADAIQSISSEFPDTAFVNIDGFNETPNPNTLYVGFREHEGSFLVGYIAGTLTQTGVVGFVGGMDIPLIRAFGSGYEQGAKAACPDCTVIQNYIGSTPAAWNDPARAKELATIQQAQGADIIYAAAGASGNGVIDFVGETLCYSPSSLPSGVTARETPLTGALAEVEKPAAFEAACGEGDQPLFFIGVDSNQNPLGDTDGDPATLNFGLTSMLKRVDVAAANAVDRVVDGTFEGGLQSLGLAEDGVGYALDEYNQALIPQELVSELEAVTEQIVSGELTVEDYRQQ